MREVQQRFMIQVGYHQLPPFAYHSSHTHTLTYLEPAPPGGVLGALLAPLCEEPHRRRGGAQVLKLVAGVLRVHDGD